MNVTKMGRWVGVAGLAFMVGCAGGASKAPATSPVYAPPSGGYPDGAGASYSQAPASAPMEESPSSPTSSTQSAPPPPAPAPMAPPSGGRSAPESTARRESRDESASEK